MALTKLQSQSIDTNITVAGVVTATSFYGDGSNLTGIGSASNATYASSAGIATYATTAGVSTNVSGGTASVTSLNVSGISTLGTLQVSSGVLTATSGIVTYYGDGSKLSNVISGVGIQSSGNVIGYGITTLNFIGLGNTFALNGTTVDISISAAGAGGTWATYTAGIATSKSVGINTSTLDDSDLTGIGNSFQGLYVSNGMIIVDNVLSGDHYIGTNFNGLMAGPVTVTGTLTVDGNYVVV